MSTGSPPRVVINTPDVVGERMAGPGIRAWHFALEIGRRYPTAVIAKFEQDGEAPPLSPAEPAPHLLERGSVRAEEAMHAADVLIGQPARRFRRRRRGQKLVHDLFDPTVLELRELYGAAPSLRQRVHLAAEWWRLSDALMTSDLLICAAARQREFYGKLQSSEARWIEVPFGIDTVGPEPAKALPTNTVVWGGGVWEWLDPTTAVDAVVGVNAAGTEANLFFLGRTRPNRDLVDRRRDDRFDALLARGAGHVFANDEWVPYAGRLSWLRGAKVAIMLHRRTAEADYSIRTRVFDAIAAGIPVVATAGGYAAELVERERLGLVVPPEDTRAVAQAILTLLSDDEIHAACVRNLERIRPRFAWDVVTQPLLAAIDSWLT